MSGARWHLIAYDIASNSARRRVHRMLTRDGLHLQRSVFLMRAPQRDLDRLLVRLASGLDLATDDLRSYHIAQPDRLWLGGDMVGLKLGVAAHAQPAGIVAYLRRVFRHE